MALYPVQTIQQPAHVPAGQRLLDIQEAQRKRVLDEQQIQSNTQGMELGGVKLQRERQALTNDAILAEKNKELTELSATRERNAAIDSFLDSTSKLLGPIYDPEVPDSDKPLIYKHVRDTIVSSGSPHAKLLPEQYDPALLKQFEDAKKTITLVSERLKILESRKKAEYDQAEESRKAAKEQRDIEASKTTGLSDRDKQFKGPAFKAYVRNYMKENGIKASELNTDSEEQLYGRLFSGFEQGLLKSSAPKNVIVGPDNHVYGYTDDGSQAPPDMSAFEDTIDEAAQKYNVPKAWIIATIQTESAGNPSIKAQDFETTGSRGLMQVTTSTARALGYQGDMEAMTNPATSIEYGVKLLGQLREKYGDDFASIYSAYNSGNPETYKNNPQVATNVKRALSNLESVQPSQDSSGTDNGYVASLDFGGAGPQVNSSNVTSQTPTSQNKGNSLGNRIMRQMPDGSLQYVAPAPEPRPAAAKSTTSITTAQRESNDARDTAQGIIRGELPPTAGMVRTKVGDAVRAELARNHYDLTTATSDWNAVQKHIAALNSTQQERLRQAINFTAETLPQIEEAYAKWKRNAGISGIKILNRAALATTKQFPGETGSSAQQLESLIADFTSEIGTVYKGGLSSTDESLKLASKNLSADWNEQTFNDAVARLKTSLAIRQNSIKNSQPAGMSTPSTNPVSTVTPANRPPLSTFEHK